jgi:hypothetical protein
MYLLPSTPSAPPMKPPASQIAWGTKVLRMIKISFKLEESFCIKVASFS